MVRPKHTPLAEDLADLDRLIARMRAGERRATSRVVTELERLSAAAPRLLRAMQPYLGHALVIGFTGPPGAGKSTLVNAYTTLLRGQGKTVGIIAVDPSSPVSGGAILGDRIRMTEMAADPGVYIRSMATRGATGGMARAAFDAVDILDVAGFDTVIIEAGDIHPPSGVTCQVHEGRNRISVSINKLVEQRLPVRFQAAGDATISQWTAEPAAVLVRGQIGSRQVVR